MNRMRIGYIPLVDASALLVAVDHGYATAEGLDVDLVREVSWSNVRDKLNIGLFDAAHFLSSMAIASSLGIGHVRVPIVVPFNLNLNGNAITISPLLYAELGARAEGDLHDPKVSSLALARLVTERRQRGAAPLTFGMTFPFSTHNYQLRFWMAAGGVDPDEDVRLVVLPPPYMAESLASGHVDGFCVGAPWNSVAVESGLGRILHFGCEIMHRATEKVLAVREGWANENPAVLSGLIRALVRAAEEIENVNARERVIATIARRLDVEPSLVARTLNGRLKVAPDGTMRQRPDYIVVGREGASRPDPVQATWLYAQMVRWRQTTLTEASQAMAQSVFRGDLFDAATGLQPTALRSCRDGIGAFAGPDFAANDINAYLDAWRLKRPVRPNLSLVR